MTTPAEAAAYLAERFNAKPAELVIPDELAPGVLEVDATPSDSRPGSTYTLIRTAGGWQHTDTDCRGWLIRGTCRHVEEKNMETGIVPATGQALSLIEEAEDAELIEAIGGKIVETWVYSFQQGGKTVVGISSKGVEEAARELAKEGEAIREIDCVLTFEDDSEARFLAKAGRYAVHADGREILLDVAVRGKRVSKVMHLTNGTTRPDDTWYEKGITKAVRNAKLALLPESMQTYIIAEAAKQGRTRQVSAPQQQRRQQLSQPRANADGEVMATPDQKNQMLQLGKQVNALGPAEAKDVWAKMHDRWPEAFPPPNAPGSNNYNALTSTRAADVIDFVQAVLRGEVLDAGDPEPIEGEVQQASLMGQ